MSMEGELNYAVAYLGFIWSTCVIFVLVSSVKHCFYLRRNITESQQQNLLSEKSSQKSVKISLLRYLNMVLPLAYLSQRLSWRNMISDLWSSHLYIRFFNLSNNLWASSRVRIMLEVATTQTVLCFAAQYGLNYMVLRDGGCRIIPTEYLCHRSTICSWNTNLDASCYLKLSLSVPHIAALGLYTLVAHIPIGAVIHTLFDIVTSPSLNEISMNRHQFSQPLLNERKTCGWTKTSSFCGIEYHGTEFLRAIPDDVSQFRRHVFDAYNQHVQDLEKGHGAAITPSATIGSRKFRKITNSKFGIAKSKRQRQVYDTNRIRTAIDTQRKVLTKEALVEFDQLWGWNGEKSAFARHSKSEIIISQLIKKNQFQRFQSSMKYLIRDSSGAMGLEILYKFVVDLMGGEGRLASRLFLRSTLLKFPRTRNRCIVTKIVAGLIIMLLNAASIYYTYKRDVGGQDRELQRIIIFTCGSQWIIYALFIESLLVIFIYHIIPRMELGEVYGAIQVLRMCTERVLSEEKGLAECYFLNAPDFLFLSNKLSRGNTHLFEADIVFSYRSFLPGMYGHLWENRSHSDIETNRALQGLCALSYAFSLTKGLSFIFKHIGCLPETWQRFFLQLLLLAFAVCVLAVLRLCWIYPWVVLAVIGIVILELRVTRCHLDGSEEFQILDEKVMIDFDALENFLPPLPSMKFTVDESKLKRKVRTQQVASPVDKEDQKDSEEKLDEDIARGESPEHPEVKVDRPEAPYRRERLLAHALGGTSMMLHSERMGEDPSDLEIRKSPSHRKDPSVHSPTSPTFRILTSLTGSPQNGSEFYKGPADRRVGYDVARIAHSAEKLDRLYDKITRKFRVMSSTVHNLESTLASVNARVNELGHPFDSDRTPTSARARNHESGKDVDATNEVTYVDEKPWSVDSDKTESEPGGVAIEHCGNGLFEECGLGNSDLSAIDSDKRSPMHRTGVFVKEKEHSDSDVGAVACSPPKIYSLGSTGDAPPAEITNDDFNLTPDTPLKLNMCGSPVIQVTPKIYPLSVVASNEAKQEWRQQKKSLAIRRNLVEGKYGLDGISIPDVDVFHTPGREDNPKRRRGKSQETSADASSPMTPQSGVVLSSIAKIEKPKKKTGKRKGQRVSKKVLPVP